MKRWVCFAGCAALGLLLAVGGWLLPVHLRALEAKVLELAGRKSNSLVYEGLLLLDRGQLGPAQMFFAAAQLQGTSGYERLGVAVTNYARTHPRAVRWGAADPPLDRLFPNEAEPTNSASGPILPVIVRPGNRAAVLESLHSSQDPLVRLLLEARGLTNTVLFPASSSASGQAMDSALALAGLLAKRQQLSTPLRDALAGLARDALSGGHSQRFEQALLDVASLGQRFDYAQLTDFLAQIEDTETLRHLARHVRQAGPELSVLFSAVCLSQTPAAVTAYLAEFSQSGLHDLGASLRYGTGGLREVLQLKQRIYGGGLRAPLVRYDPFGAVFYFALEYCWLMPKFVLAAKWLAYLAGGFFLAAALHFARSPVSALEEPLQVPGFHLAREFLFALGFLLVVLLLSEPFLAQESQRMEFPFRLRLPMVGAAAPAGTARANASLMNQLSLLSLLLFFVLQALIYTACRVKLAEIRRQPVSARIKLKLLENEDHLFDAGLYLGFVGTIISLILVSMGVIKPSLMAAYSSTSFGIIFVSVLKIFYVRPLRRKLILENEASPS
jgi:hypothetical protein